MKMNEQKRRNIFAFSCRLKSFLNQFHLELGKTKRFEFAKAKANLDAKKTSGGELKANLTHFFSRHFLILLSRFFLFKKQIFERHKPLYCTQKIT